MNGIRKPRGEQAIRQIVKPVEDALNAAKPKGHSDKKISHQESLAIGRAVTEATREANRAAKEGRITDDDAFATVPSRVGLKLLESLKQEEFVSNRDFNRLYDRAVKLDDVEGKVTYWK
jgi:hypothetical protein